MRAGKRFWWPSSLPTSTSVPIPAWVTSSRASAIVFFRIGERVALVTTPIWARPQDPLIVGRLVVNAIINNDMWIYPAPEYVVGVAARGMAMAESMVAYSPMPEHIAAGRDRYYRTPIYVQEVLHRRATARRFIPGI